MIMMNLEIARGNHRSKERTFEQMRKCNLSILTGILSVAVMVASIVLG